MNRREMLAGVGGVAAAAALNKLGGQVPNVEASLASGIIPSSRAPEFPRKADFRIDAGVTYINGAYTHPMPIGSADAARKAADGRSTLSAPAGRGGRGAGGNAASHSAIGAARLRLLPAFDARSINQLVLLGPYTLEVWGGPSWSVLRA